MRRLAMLLALLVPSIAAAKTRVLVLPLPETDAVGADAAAAFDARLVVALDETGKVTALTPAEEPECVTTACLVSLGVEHDAEQVLSLSLLREDGGLTLFATLVDVGAANAARRTELTGLDAASLAKRAPAELARWAGGARPTKIIVGVALPATGVPRDAALAFVDRLKARGIPTMALERREDRTSVTHRAEITVSALSIVKRRHRIHRYLDGVMTATVTITDVGTREVVFTKTANVTASKRARYSSTTEVAGLLVAAALDQWMDAFNVTGRK